MPEDKADIDVRALREALGMTQEEFARAVGVSFTTVSRWETGRGTPSPLARRQLEQLREGTAADASHLEDGRASNRSEES